MSCPDELTIQKWAGDRLPRDLCKSIEQHVNRCEHCSTIALRIVREDEAGCEIIAEEGSDQVPPAPPVLAQQNAAEKPLTGQESTMVGGPTQLDFADSCWPSSLALRSIELQWLRDRGFLTTPESADELGCVAHYRVLGVLGAGGMGLVLLAEDKLLHRKVAIKTIRPSNLFSESAIARLFDEARASAAIADDHIVPVYHVGEINTVPFIVMPLLQGESLQSRLSRSGKLPQSEVVWIGRDVASGLAVAHDRGLVHRDIKPGNIWLEETTGRARILDFGLVRDISRDDRITHSGVVVGTPRYVSPEQALAGELDFRSDLFSLGIVLYHLTCGRPAFPGDSATATLIAVVHDEHRPILELAPELQPKLVGLIDQLLEKSPQDRPSSAKEVAERLADIERTLIEQDKVEQTVTGAPGAEALSSTDLRSAVVGAAANRLLGHWLLAASVLLVVCGALFLTAARFAAAPDLTRVQSSDVAADGLDAAHLLATISPKIDPVKPPSDQGQPTDPFVRNDVIDYPFANPSPIEPVYQVLIRGEDFDDEAIQQLASLPLLESLTIQSAGPLALQSLAGLASKLSRLVIHVDSSNGWKKGSVLQPLRTLPSLVHLELRGAVNKKAVHEWLLALPSLASIHIRSNPTITALEVRSIRPDVDIMVDDDGLYALSDWPGRDDGNISVAPFPTLHEDAPAPAIEPLQATEAQAKQLAWAQFLNRPVESENRLGMKFRLIPPIVRQRTSIRGWGFVTTDVCCWDVPGMWFTCGMLKQGD